MLTLHAAKGLEFKIVFIVGCENNLQNPTEEERRLFYVGMTRAMHRLFLSYAKQRMWHGKRREMQITPFLAVIEPQLIEQARSDWKPKKPRKPVGKQVELF